MHEHWGYSIACDCSGLACHIDLLNSEAYLKDFIKSLLEKVDMVAWGEPLLMSLSCDDGFPEHLSGYSVVQLIHTSSLTVHINDLTKTMYLDLFSCKSFKNEDVIEVIEHYFKPQNIRVNFLTRHA